VKAKQVRDDREYAVGRTDAHPAPQAGRARVHGVRLAVIGISIVKLRVFTLRFVRLWFCHGARLARPPTDS